MGWRRIGTNKINGCSGNNMLYEAIDLFANRYGYIRRFAPLFLRTLTFAGHQRAKPLLRAVDLLKELNELGRRAVPPNAPRISF